MGINKQSNHRFCETCDEQLTWFTYHMLYHDGAYHMYCLKCYRVLLNKQLHITS